MEGRLLLNVVVREGAAILELLARKDQTLLIRRNTLLILDLRLHIIDRVARLDFERDGLAGEGLDDLSGISRDATLDFVILKPTDLHATTQAEHQVQGGLLLNVVVRERTTILQLLAGEDQTLLVRGNALLVLNLRLDIVDGVAGLHLKGDSLASDCGKPSAELPDMSQITGGYSRVLTKICMVDHFSLVKTDF